MRWSYKTVNFELKKEGLLGGSFLDEHEIEEQLNQFGQAGWELISVIEVHNGIICFFRQPLSASVLDDHSEPWDDSKVEVYPYRDLDEEPDQFDTGEHAAGPYENDDYTDHWTEPDPQAVTVEPDLDDSERMASSEYIEEELPNGQEIDAYAAYEEEIVEDAPPPEPEYEADAGEFAESENQNEEAEDTDTGIGAIRIE